MCRGSQDTSRAMPGLDRKSWFPCLAAINSSSRCSTSTRIGSRRSIRKTRTVSSGSCDGSRVRRAVDASQPPQQVGDPVMTITGYSDRINHALAFAAKHHDQQVRKGTRLPYITHPANVAIILTRYGRDDQTVVSGILHDVIEDCVREAYTREMLQQRIGDKFGEDVVDVLLAVTLRRVDDDGVELSHDERRDDYLERLSQAGESARWVCAAD